MLQTPITLPIYFNTDETTSLSDLDIDYPLSDCEIRDVKFYNIAVLLPMFDDLDDNKPYTTIISNGEKFICPLTIKEVEAQIKKQRL